MSFFISLSGPKGSQPFSIVDDCGFKEFVALLDPTYTLPSRQAPKEHGGLEIRGGEDQGQGRHAEGGGCELICGPPLIWTHM